MINLCVAILDIIISINLMAALLGMPTYFYLNRDKFAHELFIDCNFNISHEANVMIGLASVTCVLIIVANFMSLCCDFDILFGVALFFIWLSMTIQCAYIDKTRNVMKFMDDPNFMPTYNTEEDYYGKFITNICDEENITESDWERKDCLKRNIEKELKKFDKNIRIGMYYMIAWTIASLLFIVSEEQSKVILTLFVSLSMIALAYSFPIYTIGMINRHPYKEILKENPVDCDIMIGLGFGTWTLFIISVFFGSCDCECIAFTGFIISLIAEAGLVFFGIACSEEVQNISKEPILIEAGKIMYGLLIPHIIIISILGLILLCACCSCVSDSDGDGYVHNVTYIISTPTHIIIFY